VFDFMPMLKQLINQTCIVVCDDVIEDELKEKKADNNDFMLLTHRKRDEETVSPLDEERTSLYKYQES
jgi:hypothetical protein